DDVAPLNAAPSDDVAPLNAAPSDDLARVNLAPVNDVAPVSTDSLAPQSAASPWRHIGREVASGLQTLVSAAVYATLIVTFGFQVARVDGLSMAPTLEDHDRLIVNKL